MTVLSAATRSQRSTLGDLAVMWIALFGAFAYLDVPLRNAPLFAVAVVLQAALGTLVITQLLDGLQPSLLLLCGPGLILGGALSFAVFQLTGRGAVGAVTTALVGVVAAVILSKRDAQKDDSPRLWTVTQLFGLAATAMMVEFSELLPIAVLFFVIGFAMSPDRANSRWMLVLSTTLVITTITATSGFRQTYWWLVTDDYQLFDVMSKHITISGPIENWGVLNFLRYHWLSYGWSGLLDLMGGGPAPFVTLTRVMPLVYSLALSASLTLIRRQVISRSLMMSDLLPVWVIVAIVELDWSGTSTAGVYSVIAATTFPLLFLAKRGTFRPRGLLLLGIFASTLVLTKITSVFALLALCLVVATTKTTERFQREKTRSLALFFGFVVTVFATTTMTWFVGQFLGWRFDFFKVNYGLGQLSDASKSFTFVAMILLRLPLWILVIFTALETRIYAGESRRNERLNSLAGLPLLILGIMLELSVFGHANVYSYIAGPMYFIASLSILSTHNSRSQGPILEPPHRVSAVIMACLVVLGMTWSSPLVSRELWAIADQGLPFLDDLHITLLGFVTANSRVGAAIGATITVLVMLVLGHRLRLMRLLPLPLVVLTFTNLRLSSINSFRAPVSDAEISINLGDADIREVASVLREVSEESELIATNHLFDTRGNPLSDFAIAAWSRREFLILGPRFAGKTDPIKEAAINTSVNFADSPNFESCSDLREAGVNWFVVDLTATQSRDWSICSEMEFTSGNYILLSIRDPIPKGS